MGERRKELLRKYVLLGLRTLTKNNYLEGIPDYEDREEEEAFSESMLIIGRYIETGDRTEIKKVLGLPILPEGLI